MAKGCVYIIKTGKDAGKQFDSKELLAAYMNRTAALDDLMSKFKQSGGKMDVASATKWLTDNGYLKPETKEKTTTGVAPEVGQKPGTAQKVIGLDYKDGQEGEYSDDNVYGDIRIVGEDVEILDWNSKYTGRGNTEKSLQKLKQNYGGEIRAVDAGYKGEESYSYWQRMLDKGLIDGFYDDNGVLHTEKTVTSTKAEEKPIAPATEETKPTTKPSRKERISKLFETSEGEEAVPLIEQALSESGIKVEVKDDAEYNEDDRIKNGQGRGSEGMFIADDGTIILNRDKIKGEWGKTIVFHEGIHPVINIIRNTDPKRYKAIVDGLKAEAARNNDVAQVADEVAASEDYQQRGAETIEDETLVETMARVASGDIDINTFKPSFREKFIEYMNDLARMLGLKRIAINSPRMEVKRLADQINKMLNEGGKLSDIVGKENVGKFQNTIESLKTLSSPINQPSTLAQARKGIYGKKINYKKGGYELSLVKPEDIIDIEALIKKIADEKAVVWFWTADQLGRGMYSDETIEGEHYLDAGPSFALDEENRAEDVIWASGAEEKVLRDKIEESDYIFIVSGSPQQSKLFNKKVIEFLRKRTEKASGLSWNDFSKKVIDLTTKITKAGKVNKNEITNILEKYNSFEELLNSKGNDRKKLFVEMEKQRTTTNTPLSQYLKSIGLSFDVDTLRDGFYKENGFDMNDVMLVLKPTKLGGKSKHSTYEYNVLGTVIGVPDKRVNGIDLLPEERRKKYTEVQRKSPMSGAAGSMTSTIQASKGIKRGSNLVKDTYYESGLTEDKNDYVFFHVSSAPEASIRKGIDSTKYTSLRTAREEKGLQYGVASYYTRPEDGERMVGGEKYAVRVPKAKVYPIDSDPLGYGEKAEAKIPQGTPFRAEAVKREIADMAKNNGYEMIVGEWSYSRTGKPTAELPEFRADALVPLKPTKEKPESFTSNAEKGMERIPFPGQQSEQAKQELESIASEVRDIMSSKKKFSSKEYQLADSVYMSGQVTENKYEDNEFKRDITAEEYDMMTKVLPKSMQAEAARVRGLLFGKKGQASINIPRGVKQFSDNVSETVDRIKTATSEDGATLNLDGSTYEDGGLVVPAGSINVAQDDVSAEGLFEFLKDNEGNISSDIFKIGLYKFPDRPEVSYDLNIVIPREYRDVALKFGELAGQESLFDLDTFENIKTGADGKNPRKFTAQELAEIAKDLSEGRLPKIVSEEGAGIKTKAQLGSVEETAKALEEPSNVSVDKNYEVKKEVSSNIEFYRLTSKYGSIQGSFDKKMYEPVKYTEYPFKNVSALYLNASEVGKGYGYEVLKQLIDYAKQNGVIAINESSNNEFATRTYQKAVDEGLLIPFSKGLDGKDIGWLIKSKELSKEYKKAKADDSNPELVKVVEELVGEPKRGQPSMVKRTSAEVQRLMEDSLDSVDEAIADGVDAKTAVADNITSQDWYSELTPKQKEQFDEIIKDEFGVTPEAPVVKPTGVKAKIQNIVDNYYKLREGSKDEKRAAKAAINEILDADPKLKYIYNNISNINKELQAAGLITDKTDGCP